MKFLTALSLIFLSTFSQASMLDIRVHEYICGEIDPYILGDTCILRGEMEKGKIGMVLDFDSYSHLDGQIDAGDIITVNSNYIEAINIWKMERTEREVYFEFFSGEAGSLYQVELDGVIISIISSEKREVFSLTCENLNIHAGGFLEGYMKLEAELVKLGENNFELSNINLGYKFYSDSNQEDLWAEGQAHSKRYTVFNKMNYKPRVYKNHLKFPSLYSNKLFGIFDFIVPENKIIKNGEDFSAHMIMTNIEDHAGDTAELYCSIKN